MNVVATHRGRHSISVMVGGVTSETDQEIRDFATADLGEDPSRFQARRVLRYTLTPDRVNVYLDID